MLLVLVALLTGALAGASPRLAIVAAGLAAAAGLAVRSTPLVLSIALVGASFLSGAAIELGSQNVRPEQALALLVLVALLFRRRLRRPSRAFLFVGLWLVLGVLGALGEEELGRALVHTARLVLTVVPALALPMLLTTESDRERAWDAFLACAVLESLVALGALVAHERLGTSWGVTEMPGLGYVHPQGTLLEPNLLGALAAAAAAALLVRAAHGLGPLLAFALAVLLAGVAISLTRAAWIALPIALVLVFASRGSFRRRLPAFATALVLGLVVSFLGLRAAAAGGALDARTGVLGKLASLGRVLDDPNVNVRLRSYRVALRLFSESPWLGKGHGAMERLPGAEDHRLAWAGNLEVHVLVDTGLLGLAAMSAFVWLALRATTGGRPRDVERLAALLVLLICSQATEASWLSSFWVLFGLALSARGAAGRAGPVRILYVHPSDELYGSDRVLLDLVRSLDRSRFDPLVLLSSDVAYEGRLSRRLRELGIPVSRMRVGVLRRRILSSPLALSRYAVDVAVSTARLAALVVRERVDLVHANTVTVFPAAFAARLAGRPLVWHLHEIVTDRPGRGVLHALVKGLATRVVVVSEAARASLGEGTRSLVIPNGLEPRPVPPPPEQPPVIAYIGRLSERKGPHVLLRALARVHAARPDVRLVFCGDEFGGGDALASALAAEARRLGLSAAVTFEPFREDVSDLVGRASVIVSPSILPESFGLILLEAMASGRPVVASAHGGPCELVVDGETGLLVPPADDAALGDALLRLVGEPETVRRMGEAARERSLASFSLSHTVSRFADVYGSIVEAGAGDDPGPAKR